MEQKSVLVIGATGNTGRIVVELLARFTNHLMILGVRDQEKGVRLKRQLVAALGDERPDISQRISIIQVDAAVEGSLVNAIQAIDLIISASSTASDTEILAKVAADKGVSVIDAQFSADKAVRLRGLADRFIERRISYIVNGGFHPGLPGVMVRRMSSEFEQLLVANVGSRIKLNWRELSFSSETMKEFARELTSFKMTRLVNGAWQELPFWSIKPLKMDLGGGGPEEVVYPMMLEELRGLPAAIPSLLETGFFVGGFNPLVDMLILPLGLLLIKLFHERAEGLVGKLLLWGLRSSKTTSPETRLAVIAEGWAGGKKTKKRWALWHSDGYFMTAAPLVACAIQVLEGNTRPGLWTQAMYVNVEPFVEQLDRMGVYVGSVEIIE